jgi:5-methyltetrahydropteroyltriglutamate--homocysteine methyltransferase
MIRSTDRFLTTHTGSLPRPDDLIRMMYAKEEGVPVEREALAARVRAAVSEVVRKQVDAGIDLVNDGEMSKPSYATYVKDRLAGFGGTGNTFVYQDLAQFPNLAKRVFGDPGRSRRKTPACNARPCMCATPRRQRPTSAISRRRWPRCAGLQHS